MAKTSVGNCINLLQRITERMAYDENFDASQYTTAILSDMTMDVKLQSSNMEPDTWLKIVITLFYGIIFVVGVTGNALVLFIVARTPTMQTITNIFIANLSAGDIMMCMLAVPFTPLTAFLNSWHLGDTLCHLLPMTLCVSVYVSTLTSTAIAVDRFFVIVHPFRRRMKTSLCLIIIGAIWLISLSISMPLAIYQKVRKHLK